MEQTFISLKLEDRVRWYTKMRWFYVVALAGAGIVPQYLTNGYNELTKDQMSIGFMAIFMNLGFFAVCRRRNGSRYYYQVLAAAQIVFDIILATWVILLNGGIESRSIIIYAIPIIMSGALLGRLGIYLTALITTFAYVLFVSLDHFGKIIVPNITNPSMHTDPGLYWQSVFFYSGVFLVLSVIVDFVGRLVRREEQVEKEMRAVSAEKAKTDAILATMGNALVAVDLKGHITAVNYSFEELTGFSKEEVVGQTIDEAMPVLDEKGEPIPEERRPLMAVLRASIPAANRPQRVTDYYYRRKNGTIFPFVAYVAPIVLDGRVMGATTVFQDATAQQNMQQLRTNFVALASHQLRTPIGEMKGYVENMLAGVTGQVSQQQRQYLEHVQEVALRCNKLLTDLLDITVLERGSASLNPKPTSLKRIAGEVERIYHHRLAKKGLTLKTAVADDTTVIADHAKLVEAIGNVVANAIRFSKEGEIAITAKKDGPHVVISISDQGTGVDRDAITALFTKDDVLAAAPTAEGGTGLGLYLAKQLVILQGGSIALTETSNKGTTIAIRMPSKGA